MPAERSLGSTLVEIRDDLKSFAQTRAQLFRAEIREKVQVWKGSAAFLGAGAILLLGGLLAALFTLIALVHTWIASDTYAWFFAGLIVSVFLAGAGGLCGLAGYRGIKRSGVKPTRTLRVLKQDQEWIQKRTRPA